MPWSNVHLDLPEASEGMEAGYNSILDAAIPPAPSKWSEVQARRWVRGFVYGREARRRRDAIDAGKRLMGETRRYVKK